MQWPWLDVMFWYAVEGANEADRIDYSASVHALGVLAPGEFAHREEARARGEDKRTADDLMQSVIDAERRGWRDN